MTDPQSKRTAGTWLAFLAVSVLWIATVIGISADRALCVHLATSFAMVMPPFAYFLVFSIPTAFLAGLAMFAISGSLFVQYRAASTAQRLATHFACGLACVVLLLLYREASHETLLTLLRDIGEAPQAG
jgi:hypothetical protein